MPVLAQRLSAQLLAGRPARDAVAVAQRLLAIQGQDPRGARLAIRARSTGVDAADIDRELTERRSLLITWLNRGTLHLVRSEDYPLLQALTTPQLLTSNTTRLAQVGVAPDMTGRGVALIERWLADDGPLTRLVLRDRLQRAGVPVAGQALIHLLYRAAIEGRIVRGPMAGSEHAYALVRDWLPRSSPIARDRGLAELARRYLAGHGPASERDLARWAGLALGDVRAGLEAIAGELHQRPDGLVDLARRPGASEPAPPRLLGPFEPLLLGWSSRADVLGAGEAKIVAGGIFRGFALVRGRAAAGWRWVGKDIAIEPFGALSAANAAALERDAQALKRFLRRKR